MIHDEYSTYKNGKMIEVEGVKSSEANALGTEAAYNEQLYRHTESQISNISNNSDRGQDTSALIRVIDKISEENLMVDYSKLYILNQLKCQSVKNI